MGGLGGKCFTTIIEKLEKLEFLCLGVNETESVVDGLDRTMGRRRESMEIGLLLAPSDFEEWRRDHIFQCISKLVTALNRSMIQEWIISLDPLHSTKRAVNDFTPLMAYQSMNEQLPPGEQISLEIINRNETGDMAFVIKSKGCSMKRHHRWWHDITKISYLRSW